MNLALWAVQIILCIKLVDVSIKHGLRQSKPTLQEATQRLGGYSRPLLSVFAISSLLAALGLVLPGILGGPVWLTSAAALFAGLLLLISIFFHLKSRDHPKIFVSLVLLAFASFIAYGRWALVPFVN